jgi:hypothetical protein
MSATSWSSRSPNFRVDVRPFGPNSDNGNLILKWWRVQEQNSLSGIPAATRNEGYERERQIEEVSAVAT